MGYTKISGTPVITGLDTLLIPTALFALFGSSRHRVVDADSATAETLRWLLEFLQSEEIDLVMCHVPGEVRRSERWKAYGPS